MNLPRVKERNAKIIGSDKKELNREFYSWFKKLELTDKQIEERKSILNDKFEELKIKRFTRKLKWKD